MSRNLLVGSVFAVLILAVAILLYLNYAAPGKPKPKHPGTAAAGARPTPAAAEPLPASGKRNRVVLYFQGVDVGLLFPEERDVADAGDGNARARQVLEELARGPKKDLLPTIPPGTAVREVFFDASGVAYVDFSRQIRDNHAGGSAEELMTVESVVSTLARNLPQVQAVQILIEGKPVPTLAGHVDLSLPLRPDAHWMSE